MKLKKFEDLKNLLKSSLNLFSNKIPFKYKIIPLAGIAYVLLPFDFIADYIPVIGQMDDIAVLIACFSLFENLSIKYKRSI